MSSDETNWRQAKVQAHVNLKVDKDGRLPDPIVCPWCMQLRSAEEFYQKHFIDKDTEFQRVVLKTSSKCRGCRRKDADWAPHHRRRA